MSPQAEEPGQIEGTGRVEGAGRVEETGQIEEPAQPAATGDDLLQRLATRTNILLLLVIIGLLSVVLFAVLMTTSFDGGKITGSATLEQGAGSSAQALKIKPPPDPRAIEAEIARLKEQVIDCFDEALSLSEVYSDPLYQGFHGAPQNGSAYRLNEDDWRLLQELLEKEREIATELQRLDQSETLSDALREALQTVERMNKINRKLLSLLQNPRVRPYSSSVRVSEIAEEFDLARTGLD
ncbi:MAG: hypothetical protein OET90_04930 [Desulfuromonadales bacterium]|nr:hypothetical protein [Desulfuromonadales bacterium]